MSIDVLKTKTRVPDLSKGELMKERKSGKIPAVMFGHNISSTPLFIDSVEFDKMFEQHGKIFEIQVGNDKRLVNAKSIQYDPMRQFVWHVDFQVLQKGVETTVKIPVSLVGEPKGAKEGGSVQLKQSYLQITGKPKNLPEEIEVDISALNIGDNIHVSDIKLPKALNIETEMELTVATVVPPQKVEEKAEVETDTESDLIETKQS